MLLFTTGKVKKKWHCSQKMVKIWRKKRPKLKIFDTWPPMVLVTYDILNPCSLNTLLVTIVILINILQPAQVIMTVRNQVDIDQTRLSRMTGGWTTAWTRQLSCHNPSPKSNSKGLRFEVTLFWSLLQGGGGNSWQGPWCQIYWPRQVNLSKKNSVSKFYSGLWQSRVQL